MLRRIYKVTQALGPPPPPPTQLPDSTLYGSHL